MKKLLSLILAILIFALAVPAGAMTYGYLLGDANDDDGVNMKDVLLLRRFISGVVDDDGIFILAADTDVSGDLNMKDVLKLRRIVAGVA